MQLPQAKPNGSYEKRNKKIRKGDNPIPDRFAVKPQS